MIIPAVQSAETKRTSVAKQTYSFGELQVDAMLRDRPEMSTYISRGDRLSDWTARQFAGKDFPVRIFWHNNLPRDMPSGPIAACQPLDARTAWIYVRSLDSQGKKIGGDELWSAVVFELYNARNSPLVVQLYKETERGKVSKAQYIERITRMEFEAIRATNEFYRTFWLPHVLAKKLPTDPSIWHSSASDRYEDWIAGLKLQQSGYPYDSYGADYSKLLRQVQRKGRLR